MVREVSTDMDTYTASNPSSGHGHVYPRPDGALARCGGPRLCLKCAADQRRKDAEELVQASSITAPANPITEPCIAVPPEFAGTEAEAVALAVAGAVASIVTRAQEAEARADELEKALRALVDSYPRTSFAGPEAFLEEAVALLAQHRPDRTS